MKFKRLFQFSMTRQAQQLISHAHRPCCELVRADMLDFRTRSCSASCPFQAWSFSPSAHRYICDLVPSPSTKSKQRCKVNSYTIDNVILNSENDVKEEQAQYNEVQ